jgi:hypothetical protein
MKSITAWFDVSKLPEAAKKQYEPYVMKSILQLFTPGSLKKNSEFGTMPETAVYHGDLPFELIREVCFKNGIYFSDQRFKYLTEETDVFGVCLKSKSESIIQYFESQTTKLRIEGLLWTEEYFSDPDQGYSQLLHAFDIEEGKIRVGRGSIYIGVFEEMGFPFEYVD